MKELIFIGHSANIQRLVDIAELDYSIIGIIDDNYYGNTTKLDNIPVIGTELDIENTLIKYPNAVFFVVPPLRTSADWSQINSKRQGMIDRAEAYKLPLINIIHPTAIVPKTTKLGYNIFLGPYTVLQNYVTINDYSFIKEQVCLAHHCLIEKNVMLSSQCYIGSNVTIGENSYIGIKSSVIASDNNLTVGKNCLVHPGVVVMKNLPINTTASINGKVKGTFSSTILI